MSYLDELGYSQEEQRLGRALERAEDQRNNLQAKVNEQAALIKHLEASNQGLSEYLTSHTHYLNDKIERLRLCAAPGRRTAHEYERMGRPDGWTWLEGVQMWARLDQSHWDAIREVERLRELLARALGYEPQLDEEIRAALKGEKA